MHKEKETPIELALDQSQDSSEFTIDYITSLQELQGEMKKKFSGKKNSSLKLADIYDKLSTKYPRYDNTGWRVRECGTYLEFYVSSDERKLSYANFCRDRLCPMCNWRRSLKIFSQVSRVMDVIQNDYKFIFLTLTVRNCEGKDLSETVDAIYAGWRYMYNKNAIFRRGIKGTFRSLEVTRNSKTGTFHPHLHCILAVSPCYFTSRDYLKHGDWMDLWRKACKLDYDPWVYVESVKPYDKGISGVIAEVAKYSVKDVDYTDSSEVVHMFHMGLARRRLCSWTGIFSDVRQQLRLDDAEDGDLVHTETDSIRADVAYTIVTYHWKSGFYFCRETGEVVD